MNCHLFNFIDSQILVNVLYFFFASVEKREGAPTVAGINSYIKNIGDVAEVS